MINLRTTEFGRVLIAQNEGKDRYVKNCQFLRGQIDRKRDGKFLLYA